MSLRFLPIFLVVFIYAVAFGITLPLLPIYVEKLGGAPVLVGALTSTYAFSQFISGPLLGRLSDFVGRKKLLVLSQLGSAIGLCMFGLADSLPICFLAQIIDGVTGACVPLTNAYIADISRPEERAAALSTTVLAFGLGVFGGPTLAGLLASWSYRLPFFVAAVLSFLSMIMAIVLLKNVAPTHARHVGASWHGLEILSISKVRPILYQLFFYFMAFSVYLSGLAMFAERRFTNNEKHFDVKQVSMLFAINGLIQVFLQIFFLKRIVKAIKEERAVTFSLIAMAAGYFLLGQVGNPIFYPLIALFYVCGAAVARVNFLSLLSKSVDATKVGVAMGVSQSLLCLSQILGPPLGAWFIQNSLLHAWTYFLVSMCFLAMIFKLKFFNGYKATTEPTIG